MHPTTATVRTRDAFASLVRQARRGRDWSQRELADRAGVSRTTVIRFESGAATNPLPEALTAVCATLDIRQEDALRALGYLTEPQAAA